MLYAQWQSSYFDEDAPDTQVFYSRSKDGKVWEPPMELTQKWADGIITNGGWWSSGNTLVAYICKWPNKNSGFKEGYTEYMISEDGKHWESPRAVTDSENQPINGIIEQDVHALPNGRLITAFHMQLGLIVTPFYTDNSQGIRDWKAGRMDNISIDNGMSRALEPSWFYRSDSSIVMIFRDQASSFKKLASISYDGGETWTMPTLVNTPDSRAKQSAGNLPDGTTYMINNPSETKTRIPLAITLSKDGFCFDRAYLLRAGGKDLQVQRFEGKYKRKGYSYPKSVIWQNYLYVSYATNKENVELSRIPLSSLMEN